MTITAIPKVFWQRILKALHTSDSSRVCAADLSIYFGIDGETRDAGEILDCLFQMKAVGLVDEEREEGVLMWGITGVGRAQVAASIEAERSPSDDQIADFIREHGPEIRKVFGAAAIDAPEPPREAPTALCCIDEDELDDWWADQDVEVKADAFLRWALDRHTGYIYAGETERRIPVEGTLGEEARGAHPQHKPSERTAAIKYEAGPFPWKGGTPCELPVSQPDGFAGQTAR